MVNNNLKKYADLCDQIRDSGKYLKGLPIHRVGTDTITIKGNIIICDGTDTFLEWIKNLFFFRLGDHGTHAGFWNTAERLFQEIKGIADVHDHLIFTGFSRGGPLAQALALQFAKKGVNCQCVTFNSPKLGKKEFCETMAKYGVTHVRVFMSGDIVQKLPKSFDHYETDRVELLHTEKGIVNIHKNYGKYL